MSDETSIAACTALIGFVGGLVSGVAIVFAMVNPTEVADTGRAQAVACQPGTYLQTLSDGSLLCIGGKGETWIAEVER